MLMVKQYTLEKSLLVAQFLFSVMYLKTRQTLIIFTDPTLVVLYLYQLEQTVRNTVRSLQVWL